MTTDLDVAIVGAGIAGLTAAHELDRAGLEVRVFESSAVVGGRMCSFRHDGYTIDTGAEQISSRGYRATWQLLRRLGIREDEIPLIGKPVAVWRDGLIEVDPRPYLNLRRVGTADPALQLNHTFHLREALLSAGMTEDELDEVRDVMRDPGFCASSNVVYSVHGRKAPGP